MFKNICLYRILFNQVYQDQNQLKPLLLELVFQELRGSYFDKQRKMFEQLVTQKWTKKTQSEILDMFLPKKVQPEANPEKQINDNNNNDDEEHTEDEEYTETDDEEYTEMDDEEQPEDLETGSDPSLDFE